MRIGLSNHGDCQCQWILTSHLILWVQLLTQPEKVRSIYKDLATFLVSFFHRNPPFDFECNRKKGRHMRLESNPRTASVKANKLCFVFFCFGLVAAIRNVWLNQNCCAVRSRTKVGPNASIDLSSVVGWCWWMHLHKLSQNNWLRARPTRRSFSGRQQFRPNWLMHTFELATSEVSGMNQRKRGKNAWLQKNMLNLVDTKDNHHSEFTDSEL